MPNDFKKINQVTEANQFEDGDFLILERAAANFKSERSNTFPPNGAGVKNLFFPHNRSVAFGSYNTLDEQVVNIENFSFNCPDDFISLVTLELYFIPTLTIPLVNANLNSHYCNVGELFNTHAESNTLLNITHTLNLINVLDVSSVFNSLTANDAAGLELDWTNLATDIIHYLGIHLVYN